ncbi:MAG: hypothetical protein RL279_194, partial [Pseudomonadota bacterium]
CNRQTPALARCFRHFWLESRANAGVCLFFAMEIIFGDDQRVLRLLLAFRASQGPFRAQARLNGALDTNRTCDPPLRRGMLYPLSYGGMALRYAHCREVKIRAQGKSCHDA